MNVVLNLLNSEYSTLLKICSELHLNSLPTNRIGKNINRKDYLPVITIDSEIEIMKNFLPVIHSKLISMKYTSLAFICEGYYVFSTA